MRVNLYANGVISKTFVFGKEMGQPNFYSKAAAIDPVKLEAAAKRVAHIGKLYSVNGVLVFMAGQKMAQAAIDGTFGNVHSAIMNAFDAGVVLVIIFAGAAWALGHRTKALEILIGVCCGYILARHAIDIRDFLKGI